MFKEKEFDINKNSLFLEVVKIVMVKDINIKIAH